MTILHLTVAWLALAAGLPGQATPHEVALVVPGQTSHGRDQGETLTARQTAVRVGLDAR